MLQTNTVEGGDEEEPREGGKDLIRRGRAGARGRTVVQEPGEGGKGFILSLALVEQEQILVAFHMHLGMPACSRVQTR